MRSKKLRKTLGLSPELTLDLSNHRVENKYAECKALGGEYGMYKNNFNKRSMERERELQKRERERDREREIERERGERERYRDREREIEIERERGERER